MSEEKIDSTLQKQMNTAPNHEPLAVIVRRKSGFFGPVSFSSATTSGKQFDLLSATTEEATPAEIDSLSRDDNVQQIWADLPVQAWLNNSVPQISAPAVWAQGPRGRGIKIAILDTGVDSNHPDFTGRVMAADSFIGTSAGDDNGHGTHVAGIVAGSGAASNSTYVGVAPEAWLYSGKVLDAYANGRMSDVMAGIEWAVLEQEVQIINLSLGALGPSDGTDALSAMCDEAVLQRDVVICVAAGNMGPEPQTIGAPGAARFVITVGAINDANEVASFSSWGPTADGRIKPDIAFPGVGIVAAQAIGTTFGTDVQPGYSASNGTSMAAPHAAGIAALLLEANPTLGAAEIKTKIIAGGVNLDLSRNAVGIGRGDAYRSYQMVQES